MFLGVISDATWNLAPTGKAQINKVRQKLRDTIIPRGGSNLSKLIYNTYVVPTINWEPLLAKIELKDLNSLDSQMAQMINLQYGLARRDSVIGPIRPVLHYGGGLFGFTWQDICSVTRELDITLVSPVYAGRTL